MTSATGRDFPHGIATTSPSLKFSPASSSVVQPVCSPVDSKKTSPVLRLSPEKTFEFETPEDTSEGTSYKSLVVYDLSILALTSLPVLIHDSSIAKRIEDVDFEHILGLYQGSRKQVFIAFDKADSCTPKAREVLKENAVLHLSEGGNELFGTSWSRKNPNE